MSFQLSEDRIRAITGRVSRDYAALDQREPTPAFSREEYADRLSRLSAAMRKAGITTAVLSSPEAICWLHGFESRWFRAQSPEKWYPLQMTVVRTDTEEMVHFDVYHHRYLLSLGSVVSEVSLSDSDGDERLAEIAGELSRRGWLNGVIGFEKGSHVPHPAVSELVIAAFTAKGAKASDITQLVRNARRIKSPAELEAIERAAEICDAGLLAMQEEVRVGMTERQAWGALVRGMAEAGGGPAALHESVVVGPIELGHAYASERVLARGDVLCADPSGVYKRYHANVERWYVVGEEPSDELKDLAAIEAQAFDILCENAAEGVAVNTVTGLIQQHFEDCGVWGLHNWNGGYEMGLSFPPDWVGEWTFTVGEDSPDVFEAGLVTNYESIVLYPMIDTVVFETGGARRLSKLPLDVERIG
ncbi:Xaa-Pro peptidase family protein [Leucobacter sp. UT-8R-CII-1-4]|uniref:M24 family metallopeptidase n=1 Tax=Leucobacter sp. UT-8R-CII-1-4 TaxID=3040075 RepID=UPI0024A8F242|nr:Xaa-Pro peptidase family protein [Leucobacter sp. UT-8R-CII-1-4]MDI6023183.1 Xaa-Pro peptidase family protein [Leucobacter sp. UT-8R-CII-1-4]